MTKVLSSFEDLCRVFEKSRKVFEKDSIPIPRFFLKCLADTEDFINKVWDDKESRKTMSKNNVKSLTALRQKFRKYLKANFENEVARYRENPDGDEAMEEEVDQEAMKEDEEEKEFEPQSFKSIYH